MSRAAQHEGVGMARMEPRDACRSRARRRVQFEVVALAQIQALAARSRAFLVTSARRLGGFVKGTNPMARVKVLFLAANTDPNSRLELDKEFSQIRRFLDVTPEWDALEMVHEPEAEAAQLPQLLVREKPDIIHFAGHADKAGRVQLIGPNKGVSRIEPDALYQLLEAVRADVKLVFFNTCYSAPAADKVVQLVPFCIGTKEAIDDPAAIQFSALFYQGLGFGMTVAEAYKYAQAGVAVTLGGIPADERPQFRQNPKADPNKIRLRSPRARNKAPILEVGECRSDRGGPCRRHRRVAVIPVVRLAQSGCSESAERIDQGQGYGHCRS